MSPVQVQQGPRHNHQMVVNAQISLEQVLFSLWLEYKLEHLLTLVLPQHWQLLMIEDLLAYMSVLLMGLLENTVRSMRLI